MSDAANAILLAGINDAQAAQAAIAAAGEVWITFSAACQAQQMDIANAQGEKLLALVESAIDLYQASSRRLMQYERLIKTPH